MLKKRKPCVLRKLSVKTKTDNFHASWIASAIKEKEWDRKGESKRENSEAVLTQPKRLAGQNKQTSVTSFFHYYLRSCLSSPYFLIRRVPCIMSRINLQFHVNAKSCWASSSWAREDLVACVFRMYILTTSSSLFIVLTVLFGPLPNR